MTLRKVTQGAVTANDKAEKQNRTLLGGVTVDAGKLGEWTRIHSSEVKVAEKVRTFTVYDAGDYKTTDGTVIPMIAFGFAGTWSGKAKKMSTETFEGLLRASAQLAKELL